MKNEMQELAVWSLETAKSAGADGCRVSINSSRDVQISYRDRKPENIKEATTKGLNIEIFVNGRYSSQSTSDLRKEPLKEFITKAIAMTKLLAEDKFRTLPDPKYYEGRANIDLNVVDPHYESLTPEARHTLAKSIEGEALARSGKKVISVTANEQDGRGESILMASNGFEGYSESTYYVSGASVTLQDEGDRKPNGYYYVVATSGKDLPKPEEIGAKAAQRTIDLLGGKKIKTATLPVIIENQNVPRLANGFVGAMYGRNIQQKQSFLADKKGKKVAADLFTIIDDPFVIGGLGSQLFDGEGLAAKKRVMVENGVLKEFFVDWYYSRKLGWEPTTGGPSNIYIPAGKRSVKEIMKDLGKGIFVTSFIGGNSNSTTGDFSIGIFGTLFEGGEFTQAVTEMNIAGNHLNFWNKLAEVANDPWKYSSQQSPSLVFTDVVVSGI
jgi:PmbA protein